MGSFWPFDDRAVHGTARADYCVWDIFGHCWNGTSFPPWPCFVCISIGLGWHPRCESSCVHRAGCITSRHCSICLCKGVQCTSRHPQHSGDIRDASCFANCTSLLHTPGAVKESAMQNWSRATGSHPGCQCDGIVCHNLSSKCTLLDCSRHLPSVLKFWPFW
jgi:hypothetical protein